jgi:hypothetical protein
MIEGQIVLVPFPYIESDEIKLRPAVLLRQLPIPGVLGFISSKRLNVIKTNLVKWIN